MKLQHNKINKFCMTKQIKTVIKNSETGRRKQSELLAILGVFYVGGNGRDSATKPPTTKFYDCVGCAEINSNSFPSATIFPRDPMNGATSNFAQLSDPYDKLLGTYDDNQFGFKSGFVAMKFEFISQEIRTSST